MLRQLSARGFAALSIFALALSAAAQPAPEPYTFSERVGPTLDAEERAYFGLFPDAEGFASAQAHVAGDSVGVAIAREAAPDTTVTMPTTTAQALGRFIETFERYSTAFYNPDWQVIKDYVRADVPVPYVGDHNAVTLYADGGRYRGQLTYASDSLLLLAPRGEDFEWQAFEAEGLVFTRREVDGVLLRPGWLGRSYVPLLGVPLGIGVNEFRRSLKPNEGGNRFEQNVFAAVFGAVAAKAVSLFYTRRRALGAVQERVERAAWFTAETQPLEMPPEATLRPRAAERPPPEVVWKKTFGWLSLGTGSIALDGDAQTYAFTTTFDPGADPEQNVEFEKRGAFLEAAAAVQPLPWFQAGAGVYFTDDLSLDGAELQEVAASLPFFRVFADLDVVKLVWPDGRLGLAVGGGLLRSESRVAFNVPPVTGQSGVTFTYSPDGYDLSAAGFSPFYQATLSVGLPRETTLYATLHAFSPPSVDVPLFEASPDIQPDVVVYRVEPHTVTFDYVGLSVGARLNF